MTYTQDEVIALLKRKQGHMRQGAFASTIGVSAPYLNDVYAGNRPPGTRILAFLGLDKEKTVKVTYFELTGK